MQDNPLSEFGIQQAWKKMAEQKFSNASINKQDIMNAIFNESNLAIGTLKRRMKNRITLLLTSIPLFFVVLLVPNINWKPFLIVAILGQIILSLPLIIKYVTMDDSMDTSMNMLKAMQKNLTAIKFVMNYERLSLLLLVPIAAFIIWFVTFIGQGDYIKELMQRPDFYKFLLMFLIGLPLLYLYQEYLLHSTYGDDVKKLEKNITKMKLLEEV